MAFVPVSTITCKYSCVECGLHRVEVEVPARSDDPAEDAVTWLEKIATPALVRDHERRSPNCHPKTFSEVMIPVTGVDKIGGVAIQ